MLRKRPTPSPNPPVPVHALGHATPVAYIGPAKQANTRAHVQVGTNNTIHVSHTIELTDRHGLTTTTEVLLLLYPEGDVDVYRDNQPAVIRSQTEEQTLAAYDHIREQIADTGHIF